MIYYQLTAPQLSFKQLIDAIFLHRIPTNIISLTFSNDSPVMSIQDALDLVEKKRKQLSNTLRHNFLCLEIVYDLSCKTDTIVQLTNKVADAINSHLNNDAFILSLVYVDDAGKIHPTIILSDIEKSLPEPSERPLNYEELHEVIVNTLTNFHITNICMHALFQFDGETHPLAYDGVIHLICNAVFCPKIKSFMDKPSLNK